MQILEVRPNESISNGKKRAKRRFIAANSKELNDSIPLGESVPFDIGGGGANVKRKNKK